MGQYAIGLDNGGTVTKTALFDMKGHEICVASRKTQVLVPRPGYNERDMEVVWEANCACVREVLEKSGVGPSEIIGIAVCGHGKGLYLWGEDEAPVINGISSTDNRAWKIVEDWYRDGTFDAAYPKLCQQLLACQQAALLKWLKENDRAVYDRIKWVFSVKDYIRFRLTGEAYSEATDISGSGLMNVRDGKYDKELLELLGIGEVYEKIAPLKYSSDMCGTITREAAKKTGLLPGTPVAGGMFDIDSCAIAMAVTDPEQLCTITGTWSINEFISTIPITDTQIAMNSFYAIPGYHLLEECSATSAGNLDWVIKNCLDIHCLDMHCLDMQEISGKELYEELQVLVDSVRPEESDVYYLPFLYGSNAHPLAKAGFVGMSNYHTKAHMIRAVYEGVAYSHRMHIEKLLSVRDAPKVIRMGGGAVNSPLWVQMFADVLGYPIETVCGVSELGILGCAMAASVAVGIYSDYEEAAVHMVCINEPVMPDIKRHAIYNVKYQRYRTIVDALDTVWDQFTV